MTPAALAAARIGEILLAKGLLTKEQLQDVLAEQERTGQRFGEMLLERGLVSRLALASALAEQWATLEGEHVAVADAPQAGADGEVVEAIEQEWQALRAHRPIGEIFVSAGLISQEQLDRALDEQKRTGQRLGEVLVAHGAVSRLELASALAEQWDERPQLRVATDAQAPLAPPPPRPAAPPPAPAPPADEAPVPAPAPEPPAPPAAPEPETRAEVETPSKGRDDRLEEIEGRLVLIESDRRVNDLADREKTLSATALELESRIAELEQLSSATTDDGRVEALATELAELRDAIATLRAADQPGGGVDPEELSAAVDGKIAPFDERLTSFGHAVEELGTDLRGAIELLTERFAGEAERLERLAREGSAQRVSQPSEDDRAEIVRLFESRLAQLEEQVAGAAGHGELRAGELRAELAELREAVQALSAHEEPADADALTDLGVRIQALELSVEDVREAGNALGTTISSAIELLRDRLDHETSRLEQLTSEGLQSIADSPRETAVDLGPVEERVAALERAVSDGEIAGRVEELAKGLAELARSLAELDGPDHSAQAELAERIARLEAFEEQAPHGSVVADHREELEAELAGLREALATELREQETVLNARLEAEVGERIRLHGEAASERTREELEALRSEQERALHEAAAVLGTRLDALEEQARQSHEQTDRGEELAGQLAELRASFATELSEREAATSTRLETLVDDRARLVGEAAAAFADRLDLLEEQARLRDEGDRSEELVAQLAKLRGDLEELRKQGTAATVRLAEQLGSLNETAASAAQQAEALRADQERAIGETRAALEARLAALEEHTVQVSVEADRRAELATELTQVRATLEELRTREDATRTRFEERANELQEVLAEGTRQQVAALQVAQDRALLEVASELEAKLDELATRSGEDADRSERLSAGLAELRNALGRLDTRLGAGDQALESTLERLDELSDRQTAAHDALAAQLAGHVEGLEAQLAELGQADERVAADAQGALAELRSELESARAEARQAAATSRERLESLRSEQQQAAREASAALAARVEGAEQAAAERARELQQQVEESKQLADQRAQNLQGRIEAAEQGAAERARELEERVAGTLDARAAELEARLEAFDEAKARLEADLQASLDAALGRFGARLETSEQMLSKTAKQVESWLVELGERQQAAQDALADVFENRAAELDAKVDSLAEADVRLASELRAGFEGELDRFAGRLLESEETLGAAAQWLSARVDSVEERSVVAEGAIARVDGTVGSLSRAVDGLHGRIEGHMAAALAALAGWRSAEAGRHVALPEHEPRPEPTVVEAQPAPPADGFFAFVPSANGYRLVKCDGTPPPVGGELELPGVPGRLTVAKLGASPLSSDRRPCAYLELAPGSPAEDCEA